MEKFNIVQVDGSDWPVPDFDHKGRPDLLAWDDAVDAWEPEKITVAVAFDKEDAEKIKKTLERKYTSEEEATELEVERHASGDALSLEGWWEDFGESFGHERGLSETDYYGEPYNWEDWDKLCKQTPSYHDYMTIMALEAVSNIFDGNNIVDCAMDQKRRLNQEKMDQLWHLHDRLYEMDIFYSDCVTDAIDTSCVWADVKIEVNGAKKKGDKNV